MIEEWKTIEINQNYEISNLGRVRNKRTNHILKPHTRPDGYCSVLVLTGFKKYSRVYIHRLVAKYFIPNPLNKPNINHKDYNPRNNRVDNLEWCNQSENNLWSSERISKSAKEKVITDNMRKSYIEAQIRKSKNPYPTYIYKDKTGFRYKYRIKGKVVVNKHFKTLEEAIAFKNDYVAKMNENGDLKLIECLN